MTQSPIKLACAVVLVLGACGNGSNTNTGPGGGGSGGATATGGAGVGTGGSDGLAGTGGMQVPRSGGSNGTGGSAGTASGGSSGNGTGGSAGTASGGSSGTTSGGNSGTASGGRAATATGGNGGAASGGTGGTTTGCTRELLKSTMDAYFTALAAHSSSMLVLADNVKFTENGKIMKVGEEGLWKTAGTLAYAHSAFDTVGCNAASEAVVPDGSLAVPVAVRLKLQGQKITEIETIVVRPGDYKLSGTTYASNTDAIIASAASVRWEESVPANQRNTREEITAWVDKYFRIFPRGLCNTTSTCRRLENGGGNFACTAGGSCAAGPAGTGTPVISFHLIFADVETGIGVGFSLFMGNTDMHMVKMYGGQVYAVHATLGGATSTGWD